MFGFLFGIGGLRGVGNGRVRYPGRIQGCLGSEGRAYWAILKGEIGLWLRLRNGVVMAGGRPQGVAPTLYGRCRVGQNMVRSQPVVVASTNCEGGGSRRSFWVTLRNGHVVDRYRNTCIGTDTQGVTKVILKSKLRQGSFRGCENVRTSHQDLG